MADFKTINEFRKTTQLRKINEDPTYLSFFFLFNGGDRQNSPLLSGTAEDYLRNVVGDNDRADRLKKFIDLLRRINAELPWFWQSVSGLEATRQYGNLEEPFWGANKPKIEIECLENIELTGAALIDLYKRAAFDFSRWIEVIPENLRHFEMMVFVTEVRTFQQKKSDAVKDSKGNYGLYGDSTLNVSDTAVNTEMSVDAKPIFVVKLGHCQFDIDSTSDLFADLSKNPDMAKTKIGIFWKTVEQMNQVYGSNLNANLDNTLVLEKTPSNIEPNNPFNPDSDARKIGVDLGNNTINPIDKIKQKAKDKVSGAIENVTNVFDGLPGGGGSLGNAHGAFLTGTLGNLANSVTESLLARLLLGNVHGLNAASTIQDAINTASLNGILNAAGQLFGQLNFNNTGAGGNISPKKVYPENAIDSSQGPINERIHEPGVDSSPDGNLNQNVHE